MEYGKKITKESYYDGKLKSTKVEYSIPVLVMDKAQVLNEIMKSLELISSKQTTEMNINIVADRKTHAYKMVTKNYTVEM